MNETTIGRCRIKREVGRGGMATVHLARDLKPANVLFDEDGTPYLSDFGIVKMVGSKTLMATGGIVGTPAYMSLDAGPRRASQRAR